MEANIAHLPSVHVEPGHQVSLHAVRCKPVGDGASISLHIAAHSSAALRTLADTVHQARPCTLTFCSMRSVARSNASSASSSVGSPVDLVEVHAVSAILRLDPVNRTRRG